MWIRSLAFNIFFILWTWCCLAMFLPLLLWPRTFLKSARRIWVRGISLASAHILSLRFKVTGESTLPPPPFIVASKHQSAWETIVLPVLFPNSVVVLKQELTRIPIFGWYLKKIGVIPLHRSKNKRIQSLKRLLADAQGAMKQGQSILIFPEGTRVDPHRPGVYHSGIASLYLHLNIPVVPVALDSGLYWPRRSFLKYPGVITLSILRPIFPGLSRRDFMAKLQDEIESATQSLVKGSKAYVP